MNNLFFSKQSLREFLKFCNHSQSLFDKSQDISKSFITFLLVKAENELIEKMSATERYLVILLKGRALSDFPKL